MPVKAGWFLARQAEKLKSQLQAPAFEHLWKVQQYVPFAPVAQLGLWLFRRRQWFDGTAVAPKPFSGRVHGGIFCHSGTPADFHFHGVGAVARKSEVALAA